MTDSEKIEKFIENHDFEVYDYVSLNLGSFLAPEDMPLDDDWGNGVQNAVEDLMNDCDYDEFMEKVGNHI